MPRVDHDGNDFLHGKDKGALTGVGKNAIGKKPKCSGSGGDEADVSDEDDDEDDDANGSGGPPVISDPSLRMSLRH